MSLNKVCLIGNVGQDPEIRSTQTGGKIANFSLATTENWKDKNTGEKKSKTEWHRIVVFQEGLVGVIESYIKKGSKIYIEGALQTRKWTDNNGADKYTTEIVLQGYSCRMEMLGGRDAGSAGDRYEESYEEEQPKPKKQTPAKSKKAKDEDDDFEDEEMDEVPF